MALERVQILLRPDQRRRLAEEARRRETSVTALVREAVDKQYGGGDGYYRLSREERVRAVEEIAAMNGPSMTVEEMERMIDEERDAVFPPR
jgi:hypothetical protein